MNEKELRTKIKELKQQIKNQDKIIKDKFGEVDKYRIFYEGMLSRKGVEDLLTIFEAKLRKATSINEKKYIKGVINAFRVVISNDAGIKG